jgi:hypothetical protein
VPDQKQYQEMVTVAKLFDTPFVFVYSSQMASGLLSDEAEVEGKIAIGARGGTAQNSAAAIRNVRVLDFSALWLRKMGEAC